VCAFALDFFVPGAEFYGEQFLAEQFGQDFPESMLLTDF
jgi:hypothetical protein